MNKLVLSFLGALLVLGLVLPRAANSGKSEATVLQVTNREKSNLPITTDKLVFDTNTVQVKELDTKDASIVQLNTEVNEQSVNDTIAAIKKANHKGVKAIYLLLDSPGGSVFDGARLITAMENSKVPVYTVDTQFCASMCAEILEHGVQRYMIDRTMILFHPASTALMTEGEVDKIYSRLGTSKRFIDKLDMYVAKRSGQTYEAFKAKSMRVYEVDAEDALADHLIDGIVNIDFVKVTPPTVLFGNESKFDLKELRME